MKRLKFIVLFFSILSHTAFAQKNHALSQHEFHIALKSNSPFNLIDLRKQEDFDKGHIREAIPMEFLKDSFKEDILSSINKDFPVYLYCFTGNTAKNAALFLHDLGYQEVYYLEGGFANWTASSKPYVASMNYSRPIAAFTEENLKAILQRNPHVLLYFTKPNCPMCTETEATLKQTTDTLSSLRVLKIDKSKELEISEMFQIKEAPTYVYFNYGKQVWRYSGKISQDQLQKVFFH